MPRGSRRNKRQRPTKTALTRTEEEDEASAVTVQEWKYNSNEDEDGNDTHEMTTTAATVVLPTPISSLQDLPPLLRDKLQRVGIETPTVIQKYVWPILLLQQQQHSPPSPPPPPTDSPLPTTICGTSTIMNHHHLICLAPTASGKTYAYGAIMPNNNNSLLILTPTRELTQQVQRNLHTLHNNNNNNDDTITIPVLAIHGGRADRTEQWKQLLQLLVSPASSQQQQQPPPAPFAVVSRNNTNCIIVATPGRLWDLLQEFDSNNNNSSIEPNGGGRVVWHNHIGTIVLDEADRLAMDASLREQVSGILQHVIRRQSEQRSCTPRMILASATWPDRVSVVWKAWIASLDDTTITNNNKSRTYSIVVQGQHPERQDQDQKKDQQQQQQNATNASCSKQLVAASIPRTIRQVVHVCSEHKRRCKLIKTILAAQQPACHQMANNNNTTTGLVFFATIHELKSTAIFLRQNHVKCILWHGQLSQDERDGILLQQQRQQQQQQQQTVILATDIAARGIHNDDISYVIHYDFASNLEQYIHRCGRIRKCGTSYGFFLRKFKALAKDLVQLLQASQQVVDPNLLAMAVETTSGGHPAKNMKRAKLVAAASAAESAEVDYSDNDDDLFPELSGSRVIFKRAENVSKPSSDESEADDDTSQ